MQKGVDVSQTLTDHDRTGTDDEVDEVRAADEVRDADEVRVADEIEVVEAPEGEVRTSFLPEPTLPASFLAAATADAPSYDPPMSDSRAESPENLKPSPLIRLGRMLCGLR